LILNLAPVPADRVRGIYTIGGVAGRMPPRACYLAPTPARIFYADLSEHVVVSDMLRTAESSLAAVRAGRGAQPPGYSGHNFGLSIDVDIDATMKNLAHRTKADLDAWMAARGWFCHRRDGRMAHEAWHYNFLGGVIIPEKIKTTAGYLEREILRRYGSDLAPSDALCQDALERLGLYRGELDGIIGPRTTEAIRVFQRAWGIRATGKLESRTRRTLAFVAAARVTEPLLA
jgi:hypothetical protein